MNVRVERSDNTADPVEGMLVDRMGYPLSEPEVGEPIYVATKPTVTWDFCTAKIDDIKKLKEQWLVTTDNSVYVITKVLKGLH